MMQIGEPHCYCDEHCECDGLVSRPVRQQLIHRLTEALEGLVNADAGGETTPDFERAIQTAREALAADWKDAGVSESDRLDV